MTLTKSTSALSLALALAAGTHAQEEAASARSVDNPEDQIVGIGTVADVYERWAGADGELSVGEWDDGIDGLLGEDAVNLPVARWDTNADEVISLEEFANAMAETAVFHLSPGEARVSTRFSDWDEDADGSLTVEEWNAKVGEEGLFANFDADADGSLSDAELDHAFFVWDLEEVDRDGDRSIANQEFGDGLFSTYDENNNDAIEDAEFEMFGTDLRNAGLADA